MSLVKYCDTNNIPQPVDVTDGAVHVIDERLQFDSGSLKVQASVSIGEVDIAKVHIADPASDFEASVEARKQTPTGNALNVQIGPGDVISNIPILLDFDHHQIHEGESFRWSTYVSSLASASSKDIRIVVPNIDLSGSNAVNKCPHFRFEAIADSFGQLLFYEGTTFNGNGNARTPISFERNGTYTPKLLIYEDPTVNVIGTLIWQGVTFAAKNNSGAIVQSIHEFVLKNNTSYCLRFTSGTAQLKVLLRMIWYEDLAV
jgi:hypothetical protein